MPLSGSNAISNPKTDLIGDPEFIVIKNVKRKVKSIINFIEFSTETRERQVILRI